MDAVVPQRYDQELDEEIQAHLAMAKRDRIERGDTPQAAEHAARVEFVNRTLIKEVRKFGQAGHVDEKHPDP